MPTRMCVDCRDHKAQYRDPRTPPKGFGECLCVHCTEEAFTDILTRMEGEVASIEAILDTLRDDILTEPEGCLICGEPTDDAADGQLCGSCQAERDNEMMERISEERDEELLLAGQQ